MIKYGKSNNEAMNRKFRPSIFTAAIITASIVSAVALASSSLSLLSFSPPYEKPFFAFAQTPAQTHANAALSLANLIKQGQPHQGSASAPATLIDFSDLQCPLCDRFVKATEPQINSTYVQAGKVAFVFEHLPNRGFDSLPAALAAQCTNDQGKFWQYHNLLYKNQGPIDSGWAGKDNLKKFASQIPGLDMQKFNSCFDSQQYKSLVANDLALAHSLGFTQTPSFIVVKSDGSNPQKLEGPQPFPEFKALIDKELGTT
jgi:protein-disulfide isomerase